MTQTDERTPSGRVCWSCGHESHTWVPRCPGCQSWTSQASWADQPRADELKRRPAARTSGPGATRRQTPAGSERRAREVEEDDSEAADGDPGRERPVPITEVSADDHQRFSTGLAPLDRVMGGGMVENSVVLLGGDPGVGKSTLLIQMLAGSDRRRVLYATGEETRAQVTSRARRVGAARPHIHIVAETDVDLILRYAAELEVDLLAVDSVQTLQTPEISSPAGSISQVKECTSRVARFCKEDGALAAAVLICHVNKSGEHAGPNTLIHLVDAVFSFDADPELERYRVLSSSKNRFGSTAERGAFEMTAGGLAAVDRDDADQQEGRRGRGSGDEFLPLAQELLRRLVELGGVVDDDLRDRIGGRLEGVPERTR